MVSPTDVIAIERYLEGSLSPEEEAAFLEKVAAEPDLSASLQHMKAQQEWLQQQEALDELGNHLQQLQNKYRRSGEAQLPDPASAGDVRRLFWTRLGIAALMLLLLGIAVWQLWPSKDDIPHRPIAQTMSGEAGSTAAAARSAFNQGDYRRALPLLETQLDSSANAPEWLRALGIAQLELGEYAQAQTSFEALETFGPAYGSAANFYLGVVHLRQGAPERAAEHFSRVDSQSYYFPLIGRFLE